MIEAVLCFLHEDDKILLVKRKNEPFRDSWHLPGGRVEEGESFEEAVKREVKEETGYEIEVKRYLGKWLDREFGFVLNVFEGEIVSGSLRSGDDAKEVRWFQKKEIESLYIAPIMRRIIKRCVKMINKN